MQKFHHRSFEDAEREIISNFVLRLRSLDLGSIFKRCAGISRLCTYIFLFIVFSSIFILLSRESDESAITSSLGVSGRLSTTQRLGNSAKCVSYGTTINLAGLFSTLSL